MKKQQPDLPNVRRLPPRVLKELRADASMRAGALPADAQPANEAGGGDAPRVFLWAILLVGLSLTDYVLTMIAVEGVPTAREANFLPSAVLAHGALAGLALKTMSLALVMVFATVLSTTRYERHARRTLAAWSGVYLLVNAYSTTRLLGGW